MNQIDVDTGLTNFQLMKKGNAPFDKDGNKIILHHSIQKEPGPIIELPEDIHQKYTKQIHGLIESGNSFRNNEVLDKQYKNFQKKYWRWRAKQIK